MKTRLALAARVRRRDWVGEVHAILDRFLRRCVKTHISYNFLKHVWDATLQSEDVAKMLTRLQERFFKNDAELRELATLLREKNVDEALVLGVMRQMRFPAKAECEWKTRLDLGGGLYLLDW